VTRLRRHSRARTGSASFSSCPEADAGVDRITKDEDSARRQFPAARAVRAKESGHRAGADIEAQVVHRERGSVALDEAACLDHRNLQWLCSCDWGVTGLRGASTLSSASAVHATDAKIVAIDLIDDPGRIAEADLAILDR
jgi:hypothetical protein